MKEVIPREIIEQKIYPIRGRKVMLDKGLAKLYGVPTKRLNEPVRRNIKRFPVDFMFRLTRIEWSALRSQFATLKRGQHTKYLPNACTEQGVAMLSGVLHSKRAIDVNIAIMRTFVRLRKILLSRRDLADKLAKLEKKYDAQFKIVFAAIRQLMIPKEKTGKRIGFYKER